MYSNKLYRSNEYCEIPKCNIRGCKYSCSCSSINTSNNVFLTCGCPAFEDYEHKEDCEFYVSCLKIYGNIGISLCT